MTRSAWTLGASALVGTAISVAGALAPACVGTETGNPFEPTKPSLDGAKIEMVETGEPGQMRLIGEAGAIDPPTADLRFIDLEGADGFAPATVAADGSFSELVTGVIGHWYRVEALNDTARSTPVDVRVIVPMVPLPCLVLDTEDAVEFDAVTAGESIARSIRASNSCADHSIDVTVAYRLGAADFELASPPSFTLAAGAMGDIGIRFASTTAGLSEEILVITTDGGELRAISLRATVR